MKLSCFKLFLLVWLGIIGTASATSYTLSVTNQGSGTVTRNPTNSSYPAGVTVILTATPDSGWYFAGWSGDTNGTVNPLNVTVESDLVITGNFLPYPVYTLTLVTNGQGTIALNPVGSSYLSNSVVAVTATPAAGWVFAGWSEASSGSANPLSLAMDTNLSLTGTFAELPFFDQEPVSVTNVVGSTVSFSAHAVGTAPLAYQWCFSGGSLNDATNTTLLLPDVSSGQAGNYWIIATNSYGSATSSVVSLTLTNAGGSTNVVNSPTDASLRAAISLGGWVSLAFNGTLTLTNTIDIANNVFLDGKNVSATISGGNAVRLFYVAPGVTFSVTNLTLANGSCIITNSADGTNADGGAIYNNGGFVSLTDCALTNNSALSLIFGGQARGGAIFNNGGSISLNQSSVSNNAVIGGGRNGYIPLQPPSLCLGLGGAIYNLNGSVMIAGCNISSNVCQGICENPDPIDGGYGLTMGGAMYQASGSLTIDNSTFAFNLAVGGNGADLLIASPAYGGAVAVAGGSVQIDHGEFLANTASGGDAGFDGSGAPGIGGAIYSAVALTASDSSFSGNQALAGSSIDFHQQGLVAGFGGAIYNSGSAILNLCAVYSNYVQGGVVGTYDGELTTSFPGLGGGIFNASQFAVTNCTIALNSAIGGSTGFDVAGNAIGGGVLNNTNATFTALNATIASNSCSSISEVGLTNGIAVGVEIANLSGTLALHNSIIAYGGTNGNAYGNITDDGYNISSDGSATLDSGSSYSFTDPLLGPLANYGGPTLCIALLPGSPAIDSADSSDFPPIDQRGFIRPVGAGPDIGAYEFDSSLSNVLALTLPSGTNNLQLSFTAVGSSVYFLQGSTNLIDWINLSTNGPFANPTPVSQTISLEGFPVRYFRLMVQ